MSGMFLYSPAAMALLVIPREVKWCYFAFTTIVVIGLVTIFLRGYWQKAKGIDKLLLFAPIFYAAPLAAFGTEHFTLTKIIASLVPKYIPWHLFFAYFVGACFILAPLSLATRIQARLAASLLGLNFFLFVVLMDIPGWARNPGSRFALAFALRELSFSGGALAFAASLCQQGRERGTHIFATIARYFIAIPVLYYSVEQFLHADHVPGIPLEMVTPQWIFAHTFWTYLTAAVYAVAGPMLLINKKPRAAAMWIGLTVLLVVLVVYVPIAIVGRADLESFNYMADTLMYCGAVLMLANAMPREVKIPAAHDRELEQAMKIPS